MNKKKKKINYIRRIMSYFLNAIKEKINPSFINRKNKYKWLSIHNPIIKNEETFFNSNVYNENRSKKYSKKIQDILKDEIKK
tara:strand:- start:6541 stop:6786 length:246 start_codon:yes stop_codon:yes gene_type:complete